MLTAAQIVELHDQANLRGHKSIAHGSDTTGESGAWDTVGVSALARLIEAQHQANFDLWHQEDQARDPHADNAAIAAVKHAIDLLNQRRNDMVEQIDRLLIDEVGAAARQADTAAHAAAPLHSETPGLIIDRLSILSLKHFHTEEQVHRSTPEHRERNQARLAVLAEQRADLAGCLDQLWRDACEGRRRFKLYRQLKMYNDPELNPVLYESRRD